jgi:hypothetical protein
MYIPESLRVALIQLDSRVLIGSITEHERPHPSSVRPLSVDHSTALPNSTLKGGFLLGEARWTHFAERVTFVFCVCVCL